MAPPAAHPDSYVCPICSVVVPAPDPARAAGSASSAHRYRPFCSARCQRIDLGNWLGERYAVPCDPAEATDLAEATEAAASDEDDARNRRS